MIIMFDDPDGPEDERDFNTYDLETETPERIKLALRKLVAEYDVLRKSLYRRTEALNAVGLDTAFTDDHAGIIITIVDHEKATVGYERMLAGRMVDESPRSDWTKIDAFPLSTKLQNVLFNIGVRTIADALRLSDRDLLSQPNCDRILLEEFRRVLAVYRLAKSDADFAVNEWDETLAKVGLEMDDWPPVVRVEDPKRFVAWANGLGFLKTDKP
jgi:hypothetical protein